MEQENLRAFSLRGPRIVSRALNPKVWFMLISENILVNRAQVLLNRLYLVRCGALGHGSNQIWKPNVEVDHHGSRSLFEHDIISAVCLLSNLCVSVARSSLIH